MAVRISKKRGDCNIIISKIGNRITMKCKNLRRPPNAQEIIDSIKTHKIIFKS